MNQTTKLTLRLELIWWLVTALVVYVVLYPIYKSMLHYPYRIWNIIFIVAAITFVRYIFLLEHTFIARKQEVKIGLMLLCVPLVFGLISGLNGFIRGIEDGTFEPLTGHLPKVDKVFMEKYIWNEMLIFGTAAILGAIVFPLRMFQSVWRVRNRGTV